MPTRWDSESKFKLLLAIHFSTNPGTPNWDAVVKTLGSSVTTEACKQQYKAIKRLTGPDLSLSSSGNTNSNSTPVTTPRKRKRKNVENEGDDDDEPKATPRKQINGGAKRDASEPYIKLETEGDSDEFADVAYVTFASSVGTWRADFPHLGFNLGGFSASFSMT